jgi:lipase chaperone LimK
MRESRPDPQEENIEPQNEERFESDTQKIIHRHLENEEDEITDEDIRNVRVGMVPPESEVLTPERADEEFEQISDDINEENGRNEMVDGKKPHEPETPWDILEKE